MSKWMLSLSLLALMASEATASPACGQRADVLAQLSARYDEAPVALGIANGGSLIEVLTSDGGSTWTIIVSQPNGVSCLVAAGENWQELQRVATGDLGV